MSLRDIVDPPEGKGILTIGHQTQPGFCSNRPNETRIVAHYPVIVGERVFWLCSYCINGQLRKYRQAGLVIRDYRTADSN